jgi:hypothetical protein
MNFSETPTQVLSAIESLLPLLERLARLAKSLGVGGPRLPAHSYENLFLDLTLDLRDAAGKRAIVTHKQRVRFLVEDAGVVMTPIWGEGDQVRRYELEGARRLGSRREGPRQVQLLGLERSPTKNAMATIFGRRTILDGFTQNQEYFEAVVERPTKRLSIRVLFPRGRLPTEAYLTTPSGTAQKLPVRLGRDRRARIRWSQMSPTTQTVYSLRWSW